jgi:hypothetical protein
MEHYSDTADEFSSSGDSTVWLEGSRAVQTFRNPHVCTAVRQIALDIITSSPVNVLFTDGTRYAYLPIDFHSRLISCSESSESTIVWERIECLNQIDTNRRMQLIRSNFIKFLWDILKGIFAMYACGLRHGDPSLDNIGIRDGRFVLFDYNLSGKVGAANSFSTLERDLYYFSRSLRWNLAQYDLEHPLNELESILVDILPRLRHLEEFVETLSEFKHSPDYPTVVNYLDTLVLDDVRVEQTTTEPQVQ